MKQKRRKQKLGNCRYIGADQWQTIVIQARRKWLNHTVSFDLGQGDGVQLGRVVDITDDGQVTITSLPGYDRRVPGLVMTLGFVDRVLTLVGK
jgi:hypothetical protein